MEFRGKTTAVVAAAAVAAAAFLSGAARAEEPRLTFGVTGSVTAEGMENPTNLLAHAPVQELVLQAARDGVSRADAEQILGEDDAGLDHVVRAGLLRQAGEDRFVIAFNLITAADRARLDAVLAPRAQSLADAILRRRARLERMLGAYDLPGIDRRDLGFALIGCVGLDWDGLGVTAQGGYRTEAPIRANGDRYFVWAREEGPNVSYRALYWGSHNSQYGAAWATTFGDHAALPRAGLPDAGWTAAAAIGGASLPRPARWAFYGIAEQRFEAVAGVATAIMLRLREGGADMAALAADAGADAGDAQAALDLLGALGYVRRDGDLYGTAIPVLTERDRAMIEPVRAEMQAIMRRWLRENAASLHAELGNLTALRAGVPYEALFTEIWHYLFGAATARLAESGFIANPYAEGARFEGFVPFVWADTLALN